MSHSPRVNNLAPAVDNGVDYDTSDTPSIPKSIGVVGQGMINNNALLTEVLGANIQRWYPWSGLTVNTIPPEAFIGWGRKKSFHRASKKARKLGIPALSIEDGFLRSLDSGTASKYGLSVVVDDLGMYFDLSATSRLEQLILANIPQWSAAQDSTTQALMNKLCHYELSKYNSTLSCPSLNTLAQTDNKSHVLLIDQVFGDASVKGAGASAQHFKKMLKRACQQHPDAIIWIKAHPAGKQGYLTALKLPNHVHLLTESVNPIALLKQVDHVYTVSSHMGFEALMLGKQVHCFGVNWYGGWGLTDDSNTPKRLLKKVIKRRLTSYQKATGQRNKAAYQTLTTAITIEQLFYAAYFSYSRYVDPAKKQACDLNTAMNWLIRNRHWQAQLATPLTVYEFSRWKLPFVKAFVDFPKTQLFIKPKPRLKNLLHPDHFRMDLRNPTLVWGLAKRQELQAKLQKKGIAAAPIYCMEDGFIRSNGLGATLLAPLSVVIDTQGIYYDATQPSDLEQLLSTCEALTDEQQARVQRLWQKLLVQRVSKYNVGQANQLNGIGKAPISGKRRLLIVGQVEDDLSVKYCGSTITTNTGLIARVRQDNPDAYLIYKPHPDVEAGLRSGKVAEATLALVDSVAYEMAMPDCLDAVDAVHTISSLTGFEALLRGLQVTCYGLPFYAGWGLTTDIDVHAEPKRSYLQRRQRSSALTIKQLIHCTLIDYPLYRLPNGYGLAQPEQVIDYLYPATKRSEDSKLTANAQQQLKTKFMQQRQKWLARHKK
jgi:capsular polysaccharide export protein